MIELFFRLWLMCMVWFGVAIIKGVEALAELFEGSPQPTVERHPRQPMRLPEWRPEQVQAARERALVRLDVEYAHTAERMRRLARRQWRAEQ